MKKVLYVFLFFLLIGFFFLASQSIVGIKLQELRFGILRDQLMNYELSSQTLRERLKQMFLSKDDYLQEVKVNILESGIMNGETKGLEIGLSVNDRIGLGVVNGVRALNFKPSLELEEQQKIIIRLQFAFYMERTRKFSIASKKYDELEELMNDSLSDERAFANLHNGYCLVMMGERDRAFVKLQKTIDLFPGTHYAENAQLLMNFLRDGEKRKKDLKNKNQDPESLAYSLFQAGDYEETLKTLESLPTLTNDQTYVKARAMEELGKTSNAVKEYIRLVKQKDNKEVAIRANRRLMLIGNFYQESKSLVEYSKGEAAKLGDEKAATVIEEGKTLVQKPLIIEKILKEEEKSNANTEEAKEIESIKESLLVSLEEVSKESDKTLAVVKDEKIPLAAEDEKKLESRKIEELASQSKEEAVQEVVVPPPPPPIVRKLVVEPKIETYTVNVLLTDDRRITAEKIETTDKIAKLYIGKFHLEVPWNLVVSIEIPKNQKAPFIFESKNGQIQESTKLSLDREGFWTLAGRNQKLTVEELGTVRFRQ